MPLTQAGSLLNNLHKWREITSDPWILETVSGYHLEFESLPYQSKPPKLPTFSAKETELIEAEINKLIAKGAISEVHPRNDEFISNLFLVPKKTGDFRPVINLKPLNQFVQKIHFKMENIRMALNSISPGDYMVSVDLKDAYFSVPIFQPHRKYLRFLWSSRRFEFTCLPFGYSLAPRVFTKIFKPIMAYFRFLGFRVFIFIDDILLVASSAQECLDQLSIIKQTLQGLGFIVNVDKSQLTPVTEIHYLGFIINSIIMKLQLPEGKLEKIVSACTQLLAKERPSVRDVARVSGLLVSALPAVRYLQLHYRSLELCKTQALSPDLDYDKLLSLSSQARLDLHWVVVNISKFNGKFFKEPKIDVYIESDASLTGWGAACADESASGRWSPGELQYHINYLELLAAFHALQCFVFDSKSIHVRLALDNSTAVAYINSMGGTKSPELDSLSRSMWDWCLSRDIHISAQHIPGKTNVRADRLSREIYSNLEWSLDDKVFHRIISQTFVPEIDLFASRLNAKTAKFISWHPDPGAMAYDAFSISWSNMSCYAFPPFSLLPQVLAKILNDEASVLLIAPVWPTQSWYPLLLQLLIDLPIRLPRQNNLLLLPHSQEQHPLRNKLDLAAWTLSGKLSRARDFLKNQLTSSVLHGQLALRNSTKECGTSGLAGVIKNKKIYFKPLQTKLLIS